jgi:type I restriction enzyme S subunit
MTDVATIEEACDMVTDGTHYTPKDVGHGIPFLTVKDVTDTTLDFVNCSFIDEEAYRTAKSGKSTPEIGDVLFSKDGTVGKVHVVEIDRPFAVLSSLAILRPKQGRVDSAYLGHALRSPIVLQDALKRKTGSAIRRIILSDLKKVQVYLPSLPQQRRIAAILDQADALRAKRRAAIAMVDTVAGAVFLDLFGDMWAKPESLKLEPLGKHLRFVTSGGRGWAKFYNSDGARFIRSLDVQMNFIGDIDKTYVVPPDNAEARRTRVQNGDVLLTITGSRIGRVAPAPKDLEGAFISQHVAILRIDPETLDPRFLSFFLSLDAGGQRQIAKAQYGQTKPGLNFEQIRRFQIPVPPIHQQREFVRRIKAVDKLKATNRSSLNHIERLFAALQDQAFRGKL